MSSLVDDLKTPKSSLEEFSSLCVRVLRHLPNVISNEVQVRGYKVTRQESAGTTTHVRPIKDSLFIWNPNTFETKYQKFLEILESAKSGTRSFGADEKDLVDQVMYTIQQSSGAGLDLLASTGSARKHVGNRFEELIKAVVNYLEIPNEDLVFQIPYESGDGKEVYRCQTDLIISPHNKVQSTSTELDPNEVILSLKTSSKDRMGKIFLDKLLMESFSGHDVKLVGIFHNDVQRKKDDNISFTFVSGLFMVYMRFLVELDGVYFTDPPPRTEDEMYQKHISPIADFILIDIWKLIE